MRPVKWGFVGTGRIVPRFMGGFQQVPDVQAAAIYGRHREKAAALAERYGFAQVYDDMDRFVAESGIDIAYIAVTHPLHLAFAKKCLIAGIPVLCEKPLAPNLIEAREIAQCARENGVFLMEGMWSRMFPVTRQVLQWIREDRIGKIVALNGLFCIKTKPDAMDRLYDPAQAGGALLDVGIYLVSLAQMVFGRPPKQIASVAHIGAYGVDDGMAAAFGYEDGGVATLLSTFHSEGRDCATIYGTDGIIEIFEDHWRPRHVRMTCRDGVIEMHCPEDPPGHSVYGAQVSFSGEGYQFEIEHVNACIRQGLKESPLMPISESLDILETCDTLRRQWGVSFPFEEARE